MSQACTIGKPSLSPALEHADSPPQSLIPFNKATIEKWNTKTRLASNQAEKAFKALNKSLVAQIDQVWQRGCEWERVHSWG
jgi:hypothetical protein